DQHRVEPRHLSQPPKDFRERRQEPALPDVDDDRDLLDLRPGPQRQLRQRRDERRRQVVDAEVAEVLELANRLRFPRPGPAGQEDEGLAALAAVGPSSGSTPCAAHSSSSSSRAAIGSTPCRSESSSRLASSRAAWWPRARSSWLRAATSTRMAMLRPGAT